MNTIHSPEPSRRRGALALTAALAGATLLLGGLARAANVPVPNGDFSSSGNVGSIGGGVLGASATDAAIGSGPWTGTYFGALGLLVPPTLSISPGEAKIGGLLGVNVLGIVNNGGYFSQTLPVTYEAGKRYTVTARVSVTGVLDLGAIARGNVGLALRANGATLASTKTAPPQLVSLGTVGVNEYQIQLRHDVTAPVAGNVDIQLLGTPSGVLGVNLLGSATYTRVTLDASAIDPVAGAVIAIDSSTQSATVGQPFARPLTVRVEDALGDPVPNVAVTFSAPTAGAGAVLTATSVQTGPDGVATANATANTVAGAYTIGVSVAGATPAIFPMVNTAGAPASVDAFGDGTAQSADVATAFPAPLLAKVRDSYGNPVPGVMTTFSVPASGASAALSASQVPTDADGISAVTAVANALPGSYTATVQVAGVGQPSTFALRNTLPIGTTIEEGGGGSQYGEAGGAFRCALEVAVKRPDASPYAGLLVRFTAPAAGASATFFDGTNSDTPLTVATGADGKARVQAIANGIEGDYQVTAELAGADGYPPVVFSLRNLAAGSLIFTDGFDSPCRPFP